MAKRAVGQRIRELGLEGQYEQVLCDSLDLETASHADTVELGFIDGAHSLDYVRSDTIKMAQMMAERGLVFWHDYGGRGSLADLTAYLERLASRFPVYRVAGTTLAWSSAPDIRRALERDQLK